MFNIISKLGVGGKIITLGIVWEGVNWIDLAQDREKWLKSCVNGNELSRSIEFGFFLFAVEIFYFQGLSYFSPLQMASIINALIKYTACIC
jgi:hypothetical protein